MQGPSYQGPGGDEQQPVIGNKQQMHRRDHGTTCTALRHSTLCWIGLPKSSPANSQGKDDLMHGIQPSFAPQRLWNRPNPRPLTSLSIADSVQPQQKPICHILQSFCNEITPLWPRQAEGPPMGNAGISCRCLTFFVDCHGNWIDLLELAMRTRLLPLAAAVSLCLSCRFGPRRGPHRQSDLRENQRDRTKRRRRHRQSCDLGQRATHPGWDSREKRRLSRALPWSTRLNTKPILMMATIKENHYPAQQLRRIERQHGYLVGRDSRHSHERSPRQNRLVQWCGRRSENPV